MTTIPATEAKNRFGELLESVNREPVEIAKKGRTVAVVLSVDAYREMERRIRELETSAKFEGLAAWRKSAKRRRTPDPMSEDDYHTHLSGKYGR